MTTLLRTICLGILVAAAGVSCWAQASPPNRSAFRLDLKIRDSDDQRSNATRAYSFVLEDYARGHLRVGKKVPTGEKAWTDVGVNINARVEERAGDPLLATDVQVDISSLDGATIHQISWRGIARLANGRPTVISSLQDPVLQKRLDLELTVTRLP